MLTLAISKGRIYGESAAMLKQLGMAPLEDPQSSRKLVLATADPQVQVLVLRPRDVPTFVAYGAADVGIAGKDVLLEYGGGDLYEPLDLRVARCAMMLAGMAGQQQVRRRPRVATKYVLTTRRYFAAQGRQVEIIPLHGSMELAPVVGLADWIVDLVDTGGTLRANGLAPLAHIADISSRLVVNKAAMKIKHRELSALIHAISATVAERGR